MGTQFPSSCYYIRHSWYKPLLHPCLTHLLKCGNERIVVGKSPLHAYCKVCHVPCSDAQWILRIWQRHKLALFVSISSRDQPYAPDGNLYCFHPANQLSAIHAWVHPFTQISISYPHIHPSSIFSSTHPSFYPSTHHLSMHSPIIYIFVHLLTHLSIIYLLIHLFTYPSICLSICSSICPSVHHLSQGSYPYCHPCLVRHTHSIESLQCINFYV